MPENLEARLPEIRFESVDETWAKLIQDAEKQLQRYTGWLEESLRPKGTAHMAPRLEEFREAVRAFQQDLLRNAMIRNLAHLKSVGERPILIVSKDDPCLKT